MRILTEKNDSVNFVAVYSAKYVGIMIKLKNDMLFFTVGGHTEDSTGLITQKTNFKNGTEVNDFADKYKITDFNQSLFGYNESQWDQVNRLPSDFKPKEVPTTVEQLLQIINNSMVNKTCYGDLFCLQDYFARQSLSNSSSQRIAASNNLQREYEIQDKVNKKPLHLKLPSLIELDVGHETLQLETNQSNVNYTIVGDLPGFGITPDGLISLDITSNMESLRKKLYPLKQEIVASSSTASPSKLFPNISLCLCDKVEQCKKYVWKSEDIIEGNVHILKCDCGRIATGKFCEEPRDVCDICPSDSICDKTAGTASPCKCQDGFQATNWTNRVKCLDIDECFDQNGGCDQNCTNTPGSWDCSCLTGYKKNGSHCTDIDECQDKTDGCEQNCVNTLGSWKCFCQPGYIQNGPQCTDIDEYFDQNGRCDQICTNTPGSWDCSCLTGYKKNGPQCTESNKCNIRSHCPNKAYCVETPSSYKCVCFPGYFGPNCIKGNYIRLISSTINVKGDGRFLRISSSEEFKWLKEEFRETIMKMLKKGSHSKLTENDCDVHLMEFSYSQQFHVMSVRAQVITEDYLQVNDLENYLNRERVIASTTSMFNFLTHINIDDSHNACLNLNYCDENSTMCENEDSKITCGCRDGFIKVAWDLLLCEDKNECLYNSTICNNKPEDCINTVGSYMCKCNEGSLWDNTAQKCEEKTTCGSSYHSDKGLLLSPNYPGLYDSNLFCRWRINVNSGHLAKLSFFSPFALEYERDCHYDWIQVFDILPDGSRGRIGSWCGKDVPPDLTSLTSQIIVEFKTDSKINDKGFSASWTSVSGCGGLFETESGYLMSTNYSSDYPDYQNCHWVIRPPMGVSQVTLHSDSLFDLEYDAGCERDYLEANLYCKVHNLATRLLRKPCRRKKSDYPPLKTVNILFQTWVVNIHHRRSKVGRWCGQQGPGTLTFTGGDIQVWFRSDKSTGGKGFFASWTSQ